jgi:hypothetical protein
MNSIILFLIFHENFFFSLFFQEKISLYTLLIQNLKNQDSFNYSNNKIYYTILYKYFKENFYKICRNSIIKDGNIDQLLKELIEKNFGIEINPENISEIKNLCKSSVESIYKTLFPENEDVLPFQMDSEGNNNLSTVVRTQNIL